MHESDIPSQELKHCHQCCTFQLVLLVQCLLHNAHRYQLNAPNAESADNLEAKDEAWSGRLVDPVQHNSPDEEVDASKEKERIVISHGRDAHSGDYDAKSNEQQIW